MSSFTLSERCHHYGKNVHLLSDPFYEGLLARFSQEQTRQPTVSHLARQMSQFLAIQAMNYLLPKTRTQFQTRMVQVHREATIDQEVFDPSQRVVVVDLMRAGILPSQTIFDLAHEFLPASQIRQDHILLNRATDASERVVGVNISGHKIGGPIKDSFVFFPDPMGATGSSIERMINLYTELKLGVPTQFVALHFIVTPEYLKRLKPLADRLQIFALRLDRGLSAPEILKTIPGEKWDQERGLNDKQYIVPGAGGIGEILNNSFV